MRDAIALSAILGWRVFLVAEDCRTPIKDVLFEHGVHSATADPCELEARFARYPAANAALACGSGSGVLALDIDRKGPFDGFARLKELEAEFGDLPATACSSTPSGGTHLLFAFPAGSSPKNRVGLKRFAADGSRIVYHGLDVRAEGASIALPPSRRADGAYAWKLSPFSGPLAPVPGWLLALMLSEPPPRENVTPLRLPSEERVARYVVAAVEGECGELAGMSANSGRNQRLFLASARLGELVGAGVLTQDAAEAALAAAAADCGLVRDDGLTGVRATIASGMKRGIANPRVIAA